MLKKFSAFVCAFALTASFAWAQDEASSESTDESTEVYYPQSEVVSVLNATDENGNYVAEWEDGIPVLKFRVTYPDAENTYRVGFYFPGSTNNVDGFYPLNTSEKYKEANRNLVQVVVDGDTVSGNFDVSYTKLGGLVDTVACDLRIKFDGKNHRAVLMPGSEVSLTMAKLCDFRRPAKEAPYIVKKYASASYDFKICADTKHISVKEDTNSSTLNDADSAYIYISNSAVLNINNDFSCKEIFVEAGDEKNGGLAGGLIVNEGASLVADSVYFCVNNVDDRSLPYLVNNGTVSAGCMFTKGVHNNIAITDNYAGKYGLFDDAGFAADPWYFHMVAFSNPLVSKSVSGTIDMIYRAKYNNTLKTTGIIAPYLYKTDFRSAYYTWESLAGVPSPQPMYLYTSAPTDDVSLRFVGSINDEDKYDLAIEDVNPEGVYDEGQVKTFINNPYQAPIDWRSISEAAGDQFVNDVKDVHVSYVMPSLYSMYNLKTGFTTFDAPGKMYYGYLQPQISNAQLVHQNGNQSVVTVSKSDVCSYAMADEKYGKSDIVDYPYIRLYVDETDEAVQKGEGLRSVVVLYFVPGDKYDELHNSETTADYDANYGINTVWETLAETCYNSEFYGGGYIFPYLGAYEPGQTKSDKAAVIKMVKMPTEVSEQYKGYSSALADFIRVSVDKNMSEGAVKLGVLDYNLGDSELGICLGDIALNYPGRDNNLSMNINVKDGYVESEPSSLVSTNRSFEADKVYDRWDCKQLSLNLNVAQVDRTADKKVTTPNASAIKSSKGQIYVNSSVSGTLSVYDLAGRLIAEKSAEGSVSVFVPDGVYVAAYSSANSTVRSRVAVK